MSFTCPTLVFVLRRRRILHAIVLTLLRRRILRSLLFPGSFALLFLYFPELSLSLGECQLAVLACDLASSQSGHQGLFGAVRL